MSVGNDLNFGTSDYEYNQQLDSQSRVLELVKGQIGNAIKPGSRGRRL